MENPQETKKLRYPIGVIFLLFNAFCDRFTFYGLRAILVLYLRNELLFSDDYSTLVFHLFLLLCTFFPLFGAVLADSKFGKIRTIFLFTVVYAVGNGLVAAAATPPLNLPQQSCSLLGLLLLAIGTGCVRPCVVALGGDQFKIPQQEKQLGEYFSIFYFTISTGSLIAVFLTPVLRNDVTCFGSDCYSLAFSATTISMLAALVVFICGKTFYRTTRADKNVIMEVSKCIGHAALLKYKKGKSSTESHWLDHAVSSGKFERNFVQDVKDLGRLLTLYLPLPMFWALMEQQGSRWTLQASRMNGNVLGYKLKPDHMQVVNPLLVLVLIPALEKVVYPIVGKCGLLRKPLQRLACAGMLACFAFIVSGVIEMQLEAGNTNTSSSNHHIRHQRESNSLEISVEYNQTDSIFQGQPQGTEGENTFFETRLERGMLLTSVETGQAMPFNLSGTAVVYNTSRLVPDELHPTEELTPTVHMLWLLPQYIIITVAEVMFAVPGMEFSYSEAPESMKAVMQSVWLLTIACGNLIVAVIAKAKFFDTQSNEFFLFAGLMFLANCIFMLLSAPYKERGAVAKSSSKAFREMSSMSFHHTHPSIKLRRIALKKSAELEEVKEEDNNNTESLS